jgi:hypothetical protein
MGPGEASMAQLQDRQTGVMGNPNPMTDYTTEDYLTPTKVSYCITAPEEGWPMVDQIPDQLTPILRPIAETLAMLDGNAFFSAKNDWYTQYLPEAFVLFMDNGGTLGWAGQACWVTDLNHENAEVAQAYENWRMLKKLYQP